MIFHFFPNPDKYALSLVLCGSCNPNRQHFIAILYIGHTDSILHEVPYQEGPSGLSQVTLVAVGLRHHGHPFAKVMTVKDFDYYTNAPPSGKHTNTR
jgi:hypothetical protein